MSKKQKKPPVVVRREPATTRENPEMTRLRAKLWKAEQERRLLLLHAKVDAAQTTNANKNHWANADGLSADAAFSPDVRSRLRNRGRYETNNNCYAKGDMRSSGDDLVGTGPRPQLTIPSGNTGTDHSDAARAIERAFGRWRDATKLAIKFRIAEKSRVRDGQCFGVFDNNPRLKTPVKFDIRWMEDELCETPPDKAADESIVDGIRFDNFGEPVEYFFLKHHPGSRRGMMSRANDYYSVDAERVIHWTVFDRFGQTRAIPEITPSLPIYAQLRRYSQSVRTAAEVGANIAGVMKSNLPLPSEGEIEVVPRFDPITMPQGALLTLPDGYEASPFKTEQPTTTYPEFKREELNEVGRGNGKPLNVISGNSSQYNFSSGRLDHGPYHRQLGILRNDARLIAMDRIFFAWAYEAALVGEIPDGLPPVEEWEISWNWDGFDNIDPLKEANADDVRLKNGTTTLAEVYAAYGQDYAEQLRQLAAEKKLCEELDLPWPLLLMPKQTVYSDDLDTPNAEAAPSKNTSAEQAIAYALAIAGEEEAREIMDALSPQTNGNGHLNGHGRGRRRR